MASSRRLNQGRVPASIQVRPPTVRVKAPKIVVPEIKIPPIMVPPVNFGPISNTLSDLTRAIGELQGVVSSQQKIIASLDKKLSNITVSVPARPKSFQVEIDDGSGGTRQMRVRAA